MNPSRSLIRTTAVAVALTAFLCRPNLVKAGLPEPDTVFFGAIAIDGAFATANDTDVTVELRQTEEGAAVATYRMGESAAAGDRYVLRARVESSAPVNDPEATPIGGTVYLVVKKNGVIRDTRTQVISARGTFVELNFGDSDADGDGMSDRFEEQNFGSATGGDPDADPDLDGRPNRREFLQGTNPLVADGRHPADLNPADDRLNIQEVTEYALAWKLGDPWSVEPLTIPVDYVTRASALWVGGERYVFDNDPVTSAPLWWVNDTSVLPTAGPTPADSVMPLADGATETEALRSQLVLEARAAVAAGSRRVSRQAAGAAGVTRNIPWNYQLHQPFVVTLTVTPSADTRAFALEETPPTGWLVRYITGGGRLDPRNRKVKWGPFFGTEPRTFTYEVTPLDASGNGQFAGMGSFDGASQAIVGRAAVFAPGTGPVARLWVESGAPGTRLQLSGAPGQAYVVESSADLLGWDALTPATTDSEGVAWIEFPAGSDLRFFRLRP